MTDVAVALFVALLVFGAMHLPKLGDALGRAFRNSGTTGRPHAGRDPAVARQPPGSGDEAGGEASVRQRP